LSDRRYPKRPLVAVGALIIHENKVLLARRAKHPFKREWSVPGGAVEVGETVEEAVRREVREETGIEVEITAVAGIYDRICRDADGQIEYHYVLIDYLCRPMKGSGQAASDAEAVAWFTANELETLTIQQNTRELILRHLQ
jgi:mutator protein MutT